LNFRFTTRTRRGETLQEIGIPGDIREGFRQRGRAIAGGIILVQTAVVIFKSKSVRSYPTVPSQRPDFLSMSEPIAVAPQQLSLLLMADSSDNHTNKNTDMVSVEDHHRHDPPEENDGPQKPEVEETWWRDLAQEVLDPNDADWNQWQQLDTYYFHKSLTRKFYNKEITQEVYFKACSVIFLFKVLSSTTTMTEQNPVKSLWRCLSRRLVKVLEKRAHSTNNNPDTSGYGEEYGEEGSDERSMVLADSVLPSLDPNDLTVLGINLDDENGNKENDEDMTILIQLVNLLQQVMVMTNQRHHPSSSSVSGRPVAKKVRQAFSFQSVRGPQEWKVAVAYLLAFVSYEYCQIRDWKTLDATSRQWAKHCFKDLNYLNVNAGLALLGLEVLSSSSSEPPTMDGLTTSIVTELLSGTWYGRMMWCIVVIFVLRGGLPK
jgi:hypothetical protein